MPTHLDAQRHWLTVERPPTRPNSTPVEYHWLNLKGGALANCTGNTIAEVADQAHHGIEQVCDSDSFALLDLDSGEAHDYDTGRLVESIFGVTSDLGSISA